MRANKEREGIVPRKERGGRRWPLGCGPLSEGWMYEQEFAILRAHQGKSSPGRGYIHLNL